MTRMTDTGRSVDIVVTTIFDPQWLPGYIENLAKHDRVDDVTIRIICDRKTPATVYNAAAEAASRGFKVDCPTLDEQAAYVRSLGLPDDFIPWNTDNRRNIGFLRAWENGVDVLISIDDDNYCRSDSDFVGSHLVVGHRCDELDGATRAAESAPWFNVCSLLQCDTPATIYPRGFPYWGRGHEAELQDPSADIAPRTVAVNAGLWLVDPDVDAVTRLALAPRANDADHGAVVLGLDTWTPINTQNTAIIRDAVPAYYYVRMGQALEGMPIDRFGDILSGYFLQKCAKRVGHVARIGGPIADHRRTPHDLLEDLYHELAGIVLVEELIPWLQELEIEGNCYLAAYRALADALADQSDRFSGFVWDGGGRQFVRDTADRMRAWLSALQTLSGVATS